MTASAWFDGLEPDDVGAAARAIAAGSADGPEDWPRLAVESGFADSIEGYYARLRAAAVEAAAGAAAERERADDRQLVHAVRTMDDLARTANELAERLTDWAGAYLGTTKTGIDAAREIADRDPDDATEARIVGLARRVVALDAERADLRGYVERAAPGVAPNLSMLAGPVLAARLIALAGGLDALAKKPSGTVQVLGAEDALFAHLEGRATSPKHGAIFAHEYVRGTPPSVRGSAARALAGKLSIAARIDHYSGDRRPGLAEELDRRIEAVRSGAP